MFDGDRVRPAYERLLHWVQNTSPEVLAQKKEEAEALFRRIGITFAVYGEGGDTERLIPFDMMPRVFTEAEWRRLEKGVKQRARALNRFLHDVYHRAEIVRAGVIPGDLVFRNEAYEPAVVGINPPGGVYSHIVGIDLVRTGADEFFVLEDNCRTPSGVSYMLENREIMMRMFPELFRASRIEPVDDYPDRLRRTLASVAPPKCEGEPVSVVLSPGSFNSAYYEHSFLADQMGIEIVEGQDLFVQDDFVYMRTTEGPKRVDVIYRRIDDSFLDPLCFRPDSMLGVPGLMNVYRSGGRHHLLGTRGRGRRRQGGLYLRAGDDPLLPRREPDPEERPDLEVRRPRRPQVRARAPQGPRGQGGPRLGRLRHARGAEVDEGADRGLRRAHQGRSLGLHRPADAGALDLPDLRGRGRSTSRRGMSTSGPSASSARRCISVRAG